MLFIEQNVLIDSDCKTKKDVLTLLATKATELGISNNKEQLLEDLFTRENEFSTGMEEGFAIPHAKSSDINSSAIMYVRTLESIEWQTFDDSLVNNVFCLLAPELNGANAHLTILSKLATLLLEDDFKATIKSLHDSKSLYSYILFKLEGE